MKLKNGFVIRDICGEKMIVAGGTGGVNLCKVIKFNESAAFLLESVGSAEFTEESLADLLCSSYDVERDTALKDAGKLCSALKDSGIVD